VNAGLTLAAEGGGQQYEQGLGVVAVAVSADAAYGTGDIANGDALISSSAQMVDAALGFIPVVNVVNDAAQIIHGVVTGRDFAGVEMRSGDYVLRATTMAINVFGFEVIVLGGQAIKKVFVLGAQIVREANLGEKILAVAAKDGSLVKRGADVLGQLYLDEVGTLGLRGVAVSSKRVLEIVGEALQSNESKLFTLSGTASKAEADAAGRVFVGDGAFLSTDGKVLISADSTKRYKFPSYKTNRTVNHFYQANFERWTGEGGNKVSSGHLFITLGCEGCLLTRPRAAGRVAFVDDFSQSLALAGMN
jgi:hypothetical protein